MKMVVLMYLDEDRPNVERLLEGHGVTVFSHLSMEGRHTGVQGGGWYGDVSPYRSSMTLALLPRPRALELMEAVAATEDVGDSDHPVHAILLDVEAQVESNTAEHPRNDDDGV